MDDNKKQAVALMRYSAISPAITGALDNYGSLNACFRDISARGIKAPDGSIRHYAVTTMEKWYAAYKKHGFDALVPTSRSDCGTSRKIDDALEEEIRYLKHTYPRLSAAAIYRQLQDKGSIRKGELSEATILRFINQMSLREQLTNNQDLRRYERPHINEVWCGDSSVGPRLFLPDGSRQKVYIIALIDDASRFIVGIDVFFNDNFVNLMSVLKSAVSKYGVPSVLNFDNGSPYRNQQMELLAARIGSSINYCQPYTPTSKAKIERWFRTMKDQWMASLNMRDFHSIDELRGSLFAFVQLYNHRVHSSLNGSSPSDRFFSESERIRRLSDETIQKSFLLEIERRVSPDCVITIDQVEYEVDPAFARQRVRLRYSSDMSKIFVIDPSGELVPIRLLNKHENAVIKRNKLHLSEGGESL